MVYAKDSQGFGRQNLSRNKQIKDLSTCVETRRKSRNSGVNGGKEGD